MVFRQFAGVLALLAITVPASADVVTTCSMGGPTPGSRAMRFDLPQGTDFLSLEPKGVRQARPVSDDSSWHLAQGIFVVNAQTLALEAFRVESSGSAPRRVMVRSDGTTLVEQSTVAPDGPFYHNAARPRAGLPAGSYYVIGFGSDGGRAFPNEQWGVDVRVGGAVSCAAVGSGTVFDVDHTEFSGGSAIYAHAVGTAEDLTYEADWDGDLIVGLMDAAVQGPGEAELVSETPLGSDEVEDEIAPFVSVAGEHEFSGGFQGVYPLLLVAGVSVDLN